MPLPFAPLRFVLTSLFLMGITISVTAQNSVWNGRDLRKGATDKIGKTKKGLKAYKEHLEQWGLDTNYNRGLLIGGKANSNGWSGNVFYEKRLGYKVTGFWTLSFSEIKHEKQIKEQAASNAYPQLGNPSPFVFGKINNLYTLQLGYGRDVLLLPSVAEGNISVSFRYDGGFSLAMLKPYYLKLIYTDNVNDIAYLKEEKYSSSNADKFLNSGAILGASKWSKGLGETDYVPGLYLEGAVAIMPGNAKAFIQLITLGINAAYYAKSLPIMADEKAFPYQISLFAGLDIGKRWK